MSFSQTPTRYLVHSWEQFYERKKDGGISSDISDKVTEAQSLPPRTSAQKAKLMALTWALELRTGKILDIYTDCQCAYALLHAHRAIWKQRVVLKVEKEQGKHGLNILRLLEAVRFLKQVTVIHCKGSSKRPNRGKKGKQWSRWSCQKGSSRTSNLATTPHT